MKIVMLITLCIAISALSCKKNPTVYPQVKLGTYTGYFFSSSVNKNPSFATVLQTNKITLNLRATTYDCTSPYAFFGAAARGSYSYNAGVASFRDSTVHTANFDSNMILSGDYNTRVFGDSLVLEKQVGPIRYGYALKKQ